ncbi:ABC transporter permease [Cryobacterium glaciale]|uniref:Autoinducer 2 import system permease protein LsrD n=1 Tax=Cryobacterium glaciale TaxID=1259145 RepID=A0A4R8V5W5_9MICO|nr:ABC transporter permease [Cryobacterium glaciale]TFB76482.1 ABC transporter permease [Cryobacterium glaciale]
MTSPVDMRMDVRWKRLFSGGSGAIWIATIALFLLSPIVAPGSLDAAPVVGMLPFAAVLGIAAVGQTLVIQQRGLDLSVPGMMAFGAVLVSSLPQNYGWPVWAAIIAAIVLPGAVGLVNGILVTYFGVMPLVVTLGMNAVLLGTVFGLSNGTPAGSPAPLADFASDKSAGVPNALLVAILVVALAGFITQRSTIGRRLTAVGVSEKSAAAVGIRVRSYQMLAYAFAGVAYGIAAVLYTGYVSTPPLFFGESYLLPTVAAVVLGGTALTGGRAALISTGIAALFLTQLGQLLRALGWPEPLQLLAQAGVLLSVVLLRELVPALARARASRAERSTRPRSSATAEVEPSGSRR